jgi:hypothetical protein
MVGSCAKTGSLGHSDSTSYQSVLSSNLLLMDTQVCLCNFLEAPFACAFMAHSISVLAVLSVTEQIHLPMNLFSVLRFSLLCDYFYMFLRVYYLCRWTLIFLWGILIFNM